MRARENPFASDRLHQLPYRLRGLTWSALRDRLEALQYRAAIVGPYGSGKSRLLGELESRLADNPFTIKRLRLSNDVRAFPRGFVRRFLQDLSPTDLILFDEANQLNPFTWAYFKWRSHRAGGLIITSHRPGLLPTLTTCAVTLDLLADLVTELLGEAPPPDLKPRLIRLHHRHRGNLHLILGDLYEWYAVKE